MTKSKKRGKRLIKIVCFSLAAVVLLLVSLSLFVGKSGFIFSKDKFTVNDYSGIMKESITSNPRAVDIAMLGAHDAFSHKITKNSKIDPFEKSDSVYNNSTLKIFMDGMFFRTTKTQKSGAFELLGRGVRYFDVRVTISDNEWYTMHAFLSDKLESYLIDTISFLQNNPGEFIVFDMQHCKLGGHTFKELFDYIDSVKLNNKSLFDFVSYDPVAVSLEQLRYNDITSAEHGGIVILAKTEQYDGCPHYKYEDSIRSVWHEKNTQNGILAEIDAEYNTLKNDSDLDRNKFRVNQAQMSAISKPDVFFDTLIGWSLLDMANNFNPKLAAHDNFSEWLTVLPIFMVDYSDSMKGGFNDTVIEKINRFNAAQ